MSSDTADLELNYRRQRRAFREAERIDDLQNQYNIVLEISNSLESLKRCSLMDEDDARILESDKFALEGRLKLKRKDDLSSVKRSYISAASVLQPSDETTRKGKLMGAYKAFYMSLAYKYSAFQCLWLGKIGLEGSVKDMQEALTWAGHQVDRLQEAEIEPRYNHVKYLSYWLNVFTARSELLKPKEEFKKDNAIQAILKACDDAKFFSDPNAIFPNRYINYQDLSNEIIFIEAYEALLNRDLPNCIEKLHDWMKHSNALKNSWRYQNIKFRAEILPLLNVEGVEISKYRSVYYRIMNKARRILEHERLGFNCVALIDRVDFVAKLYLNNALTSQVYENTYEEICSLFSVDSKVVKHETLTTLIGRVEESPFEYLPNYFYREFYKLTTAEDDEVVCIASELLANYFRIVCEYHCLLAAKYKGANWFRGLPDNLRTDFLNMNLYELVESTYLLWKALKKRGDVFNKSKKLRIQSFANSLASKSREDIIRFVRTTLSATFNGLFPLIVYVESASEDSDSCEYIVRRVWKKGDDDCIRLYGPRLNLEEKQYCYLKPRWKRYSYEQFPADKATFAILPASLVQNTILSDRTFQGSIEEWKGDIENLLKGDESTQLDFKSQPSTKRDVLEFLIAFGNNIPDGGKLILGAGEEKGPLTGERAVIGFTPSEEFVNNLYSQARFNVDPPLVFQLFIKRHKGKEVLVIDVKSLPFDHPYPHILHNRLKTWFRDGASTCSYEGFLEIMARFERQKEHSKFKGGI